MVSFRVSNRPRPFLEIRCFALAAGGAWDFLLGIPVGMLVATAVELSEAKAAGVDAEDLQRKQPAIIVPVFRLSLNPDMTMVQKTAAENT